MKTTRNDISRYTCFVALHGDSKHKRCELRVNFDAMAEAILIAISNSKVEIEALRFSQPSFFRTEKNNYLLFLFRVLYGPKML